MKLDSLIRYSALALALALAPNSSQAHDRDDTNDGHDDGGVVFTMDNAAAANHVLAFRRSAEGKLQHDGLLATGGRGTGSVL